MRSHRWQKNLENCLEGHNDRKTQEKSACGKAAYATRRHAVRIAMPSGESREGALTDVLERIALPVQDAEQMQQDDRDDRHAEQP
jgi:hypothetical protein